MNPNEKTLLNSLITENNLQSGIIVSPAFTGKTYALCYKAVLEAEKGGTVIIVKDSKQQHIRGGGTLDTLRKVCEDIKNSRHGPICPPNPRYSENSMTFSVNSGRIRLVDLEYTPDVQVDLALIDCVSDISCYTRTNSKHTIMATSHYELVNSPLGKLLLKEKNNLKGEVVGMSFDNRSALLMVNTPVVRVSSYDVLGDIDTSEYYLSGTTKGFYLEIKCYDKILAEDNPQYVAMMKSAKGEVYTRMVCTDYSECLKYKTLKDCEELQPRRSFTMLPSDKLPNGEYKYDIKLMGIEGEGETPICRVPEGLMPKTVILKLPKQLLDGGEGDTKVLYSILRDASKLEGPVALEFR